MSLSLGARGPRSGFSWGWEAAAEIVGWVKDGTGAPEGWVTKICKLLCLEYCGGSGEDKRNGWEWDVTLFHMHRLYFISQRCVGK